MYDDLLRRWISSLQQQQKQQADRQRQHCQSAIMPEDEAKLRQIVQESEFEQLESRKQLDALMQSLAPPSASSSSATSAASSAAPIATIAPLSYHVSISPHSRFALGCAVQPRPHRQHTNVLQASYLSHFLFNRSGPKASFSNIADRMAQYFRGTDYEKYCLTSTQVYPSILLSTCLLSYTSSFC
jgi:hypothetical protein